MFTPNSQMKDILSTSPLIESILFQKYRLGFSSNFYLTDTLEEVFKKNKMTHLIEDFLKEIQEILDLEKKIQINPKELKELLEKESVLLLDVREDFEREIAKIENSFLLTKDLAKEILFSWEKNTKMVFYCHTGVRSLQAAFFFYKNGFRNIWNLNGGIHRWAKEIDPNIPLY
ncbi:MAG: rhodanese-like domain-containing protein [Leptonema sp. (in: bacteria)]